MINKKIALVLVSLLTFFLTACTQKASDPKQDNWDKYQEQGSITIGFDNTFVPWDLKKRMANIQDLILIWHKLSQKN